MATQKIKPQTLKGFRDFLPEEKRKRDFAVEKIRQTFELFGFEPLETPALEYAETLLGKYGDEADKLMYLFEDRGKRKVGMRYDQTVPLARLVAQYSDLPKPFKRYQIQPVWRSDNPQSGRYREFLQCDIDIVGASSSLSDAEIIACTLEAFKKLGFKNATMRINDRSIFDDLGLTKTAIITLDKLEKIGKEKVIKELQQKNFQEADKIFASLETSQKNSRLNEIFSVLTSYGFTEGRDFVFDPFLARGLEYYTSTIFELKVNEYKTGSLAGGGRYDKLIGQFIGVETPATGIAFGFDRIINAMEELKLFPQSVSDSSTDVLVTIFNEGLLNDSVKVVNELRKTGINSEIYDKASIKLDKQLKYADRKGIQYVIIVGPEEIKKNVIKLKNMKTGEQKELTINQLINLLCKSIRTSQ